MAEPTMKRLYARLVLWLIRPALALQQPQITVTVDTQARSRFAGGADNLIPGQITAAQWQAESAMSMARCVGRHEEAARAPASTPARTPECSRHPLPDTLAVAGEAWPSAPGTAPK